MVGGCCTQIWFNLLRTPNFKNGGYEVERELILGRLVLLLSMIDYFYIKTLQQSPNFSQK